MDEYTYIVNGVPLDNDNFGWRLLRRSQILTGVVKNLASVSIPGRHGVLPGVPAFKSAPTSTIVVRSPLTSLEYLYAVFEKNAGLGTIAVEGIADRVANFELASIESEGITGGDELVNVSITFRLPTADWRSATQLELGPFSMTSSQQDISVFTGMTSDIRDADIFISGNFGNVIIKDKGRGSFAQTVKTFPYVAGSGLLIVTSTGQAYRASTGTPWVPSDDVSEYIEVSGGGGFNLTPYWDVSPDSIGGTMNVTVTNYNGVQIKVRGYNAYSMRRTTGLT